MRIERKRVDFGFGNTGTLQIVFLALKLTSTVDWAWQIVFLPVIVPLIIWMIIFLLAILLTIFSNNQERHDEDE